MTAARRGILCFAGNDWWVHNPMTEKQWMRRLAGRGWTVLFVNSIGVGMPGFDSPGVWKRIRGKFRSLLRWLRKSEGVWVLTPLVLPFWSVRFVRRLNIWMLAVQIRMILRWINMKHPVFWSGLPTAASLLDRIPCAGVVYYIQDHFLAYYDRMRFTRIPEDHQQMLDAADTVICASVGMADLVGKQHRCVRYIPHGVSDRFLSMPLDEPPPPPEPLKKLPRPLIGYWGSLEALQDRDLIEHLARRHPEWSLVFIGKPLFDLGPFAAYPNVYFLGPVPHERIPEYGVHFDVAMLSFVQSEWILYSCPIKFREYLALGRPVVSVKIIEVERAYPGAARVADSHEAFCRHVEEALLSRSPEEVSARRRLVAGASWEATTDRVEAVLNNSGS